MIKELLNFKHDVDNLPTAIGLAETIDRKCREMINFASFTNYFIKNDFYNEEEDVPANLRTITGILEKALSLCETPQEELYTVFVFKNAQNHATKALAAYDVMSKADEKEKKRMKMMMELVELKALCDDDDDRSDLITPKDMFSRIETAKDNMYNFEKYYNSLSNESKN